jgi:DNA repair exonuclease SbcCD ATPase subunit
MTFKLKNITVKNFMSVGNQTQAVDFDKESLTLVLGANLDLGGDDTGSRNGTGKTTIINALSYALYGQALTNIRKENLINKTNGKNMLVTVEFEKDNLHYRIERGRKPNLLKLYVNDEPIDNDSEDDSQGDSRETQKSIDQMLQLSHTMFKHLVALNTYTEPFLSMPAGEQRDIIEELLGITLLSEKAENLKVQIKDIKDQIQQENFRIEGVKKANDNIEKSIESLKTKSSAWDRAQNQEIDSLERAINQLLSVDIDNELKLHAKLKEWGTANAKITSLNKERATLEAAVNQSNKTLAKQRRALLQLKDNKCPACEQNLQDHKHKEMTEAAEKTVIESEEYHNKITSDLKKVMNELVEIGNLSAKPITFYDTESEALGHKNNLSSLEKELTTKSMQQNPYEEQIRELKDTALQEISWDTINVLSKLKDHQEFLLKLLTNKDSFIRKRIIDQNLNYLNKRLGYYIDRLGLPHRVMFQNDLTVEITQLGQDLDFDNLSRGERNRLILSLSFAFRDVWEGLYQNINLLFIDEMVDSGMDAAGVESSLAVLKKMSRERHKNIYLISHKDELIGRVNNVLKVIKENGFTSYSNSTDYVEK